MIDLTDPQWDDPLAALVEHAYAEVNPYPAEDTLRFFGEMGPAMVRLGVLDDEGTPIALIAACPRRFGRQEPLAMWQVWYLAVHEDHRRHHLALDLLRALEGTVRTRGARGLWLGTWPHATAAQRCYERARWVRDDDSLIWTVPPHLIYRRWL